MKTSKQTHAIDLEIVVPAFFSLFVLAPMSWAFYCFMSSILLSIK